MNLNKRISTLVGIIIIIATAVIFIGGVFAYQYFRVGQNIVSSPIILSESQAADIAVNTAISEGLTSLSKSCLSVVVSKNELSVIDFEIREVHGGVCGGDPSVSPLVATVEVNLHTGVGNIIQPPTKPSISNVVLTDEVGSHGTSISGYTDVFVASQYITITWDSVEVDKINIYWNKGDTNISLAMGVNNTGRYEWALPEDMAAYRAGDNSYKILVSSADNENIKAESKSFRLEGAHPVEN